MYFDFVFEVMAGTETGGKKMYKVWKKLKVMADSDWVEAKWFNTGSTDGQNCGILKDSKAISSWPSSLRTDM